MGVFAPPQDPPFVFESQGKIHLNPFAHRILIRSDEPLPSKLLKSELPSTLPTTVATVEDRSARATEGGGAGRDRTDDLLLAKQALSQLSYSPAWRVGVGGSGWIRTIDPRLIKTVL